MNIEWNERRVAEGNGFICKRLIPTINYHRMVCFGSSALIWVSEKITRVIDINDPLAYAELLFLERGGRTAHLEEMDYRLEPCFQSSFIEEKRPRRSGQKYNKWANA